MMLLVSLALLTGCETGSASSDPCALFRVILVSADDRLTDGTARAILTHNLTGERACNWKRTLGNVSPQPSATVVR